MKPDYPPCPVVTPKRARKKTGYCRVSLVLGDHPEIHGPTGRQLEHYVLRENLTIAQGEALMRQVLKLWANA